jgi:hypothetical protein
MKRDELKTRLPFLLIGLLTIAPLVCVLVLAWAPRAESRGAARVRFRVAMHEERAGRERKLISEAEVEGPSGTDFSVSLESERFRLNAEFVTDLIRGAEADALKVTAKLDTRRLYGYSERDLPLYEEDRQRHSLRVGLDETIVLLPFGRDEDGVGDNLRVEITPEVVVGPTTADASGADTPQIRILKAAPGGINVRAFKVPHRYEVEATLFEDGQAVARATSECLLEEARQLRLVPSESAHADVASNPLAINLTIEHFGREQAAGLLAVRFDILRAGDERGEGREVVASNWAGAGPPGSEMKYDLGDLYTPRPGHKYELRLSVRPVP